MQGPTHARRLAALTWRHLALVEDAAADGRITETERDDITASGADVLCLAAVIESGARLAAAAQRATDRRYLDGLAAEHEAWLSRLPAA